MTTIIQIHLLIMTSFNDLPIEIIRLVFEYFSPAEIVSEIFLLHNRVDFFVFLGPYIFNSKSKNGRNCLETYY